MRTILTGIFILFLASPALALEDTPENRDAQAKRYLEAVPPAEMIATMTDKVANALPPQGRAEFKQVMADLASSGKIEKMTHDTLVKVFTADELKALADFYSTPVAKSAISKMGTYMAELMPTIQQLMEDALQKMKMRARKHRSQEN